MPLSLAIIMVSLGIGLTLGDFRRIATHSKAFFLGAVFQVILVPIVAYLMIMVFGLSGELAAGVMLLAFCPGGMTSNIVSRLANGDVALSVSLTAVISLVSILTVPVLVGWAVVHFMGAEAPEVSVASLAIAMFLITTLPVVLGMVIRRLAPDFAQRAEPKLVTLASILFLLIILLALADNWDVFIGNLAQLGPALASLIIVMMILGLIAAGVMGLSWRERKTISIEVGIQNGTLGVTLAPIIAGVSAGIPAIGLPSAVYGILMYVISVPFVLWMRQK